MDLETLQRPGSLSQARQLVLPRYERPREELADLPPLPASDVIRYADAGEAIARSALTEGQKLLLRGLLKIGCTRTFPGGGVGIEYGSLLKTAARPEYVGKHVAETADHLRRCAVDLLLVPGMSGYPIGAMYSLAAGIPAILLKKNRLVADGLYPEGAFVIPSYTGEGDVVMSADEAAVDDIVESIVLPRIESQCGETEVTLRIRAAGADDIIDKATMSQAVGESAVVIGKAAIDRVVRRYRDRTGDSRVVHADVEVVAWVTPLIKRYNRPHEHIRKHFGIEPFAGLSVTSVHLDPLAIGIEGIGVIEFAGAR